MTLVECILMVLHKWIVILLIKPKQLLHFTSAWASMCLHTPIIILIPFPIAILKFLLSATSALRA